MKALVFVKNGHAVTDSLKVAESFGKEHRRVLQDIRDLDCSDKFREHNFVQSSYINNQNKDMPLIVMNRKGFTLLAFSYTGKEATKFKESYIEQFEVMEEELRKPKTLTEREQLVASMKLSIEMSEEVGVLKGEVAEIKDTLKNKMTIDHAKQSVLQSQINFRIAKLWDLEETRQNFSKRKLYSKLHSNLHRAFMVTSYKDVKDSEFDEALAWVQSWRPLI
ncbi:Rha family transcriptional regulator [Bacillus cihuensis]|uniref:Rha family transcriptional regulator n=1 Tax=Bacillus cihuensis TaxID=1208599 RepID=UPI000428B4F4|nr:Rha family transcriptional regulator [Bacillus cihuensis]